MQTVKRASRFGRDRLGFNQLPGYHASTMGPELNFIVGVLAIVYGLYSYYRRKTAPQDIAKLQELIERNGEKMANSIHLFGYTILPIVAGMLMLLAAYRSYGG